MSLRLQLQMVSRCWRRYSSVFASAPHSPPAMLSKIRNDMKDAMRAKDNLRLDVLRGIIAETTNAAKTSSPITSDSRMIALIRKQVKASESTISEFERAGRSELKERELAQVSILEGYLNDANVMTEEELIQMLQNEISKMKNAGFKMDKGSVMKALVGPGGPLQDSLADKKDIARLTDGMIRKELSEEAHDQPTRLVE